MEDKSTNPTPLKKSERQERFLESFEKSPFNISVSCRNAGIHRSTFYAWLKGKRFSEKVWEIRESRLDLIEEALMHRISKGDTIAIIFALKTLGKDRGYVEARPQDLRTEVAEEAKTILDELLQEKIDPVIAAYKFDRAGIKIPPGLETVLKRTVMPEPEEPEEAGVTDEELEALYQERMQNVEKEKDDFLPKRKAEVEEMKEELGGKDSFSEEVTSGGIKQGGGY